MPDEQETKVCTYCGKEIKAIAKKCKHCGEWVDKPADTISQNESTVESVSSNVSSNFYASLFVLTTLCMSINVAALTIMLISFLK